MARNLLAPWAELVPDVGPMMIDQLLALPQDLWIYELVDGQLVRMPASGREASDIALRLAAALVTFAKERGLGRVTGAYSENVPDTVREPGRDSAGAKCGVRARGARAGAGLRRIQARVARRA